MTQRQIKVWLFQAADQTTDGRSYEEFKFLSRTSLTRPSFNFSGEDWGELPSWAAAVLVVKVLPWCWWGGSSSDNEGLVTLSKSGLKRNLRVMVFPWVCVPIVLPGGAGHVWEVLLDQSGGAAHCVLVHVSMINHYRGYLHLVASKHSLRRCEWKWSPVNIPTSEALAEGRSLMKQQKPELYLKDHLHRISVCRIGGILYINQFGAEIIEQRLRRRIDQRDLGE